MYGKQTGTMHRNTLPTKSHTSKSDTKLFFLFFFLTGCKSMHWTPHILTMFWYTWLFNLPELATSKGIKLFPTTADNKCLSVLIMFYIDVHHSVDIAQHLCLYQAMIRQTPGSSSALGWVMATLGAQSERLWDRNAVMNAVIGLNDKYQ